MENLKNTDSNTAIAKKRLSEEIEELLEQLPLKIGSGERTITIGEFIEHISSRGFEVALLLFSLPVAFPAPAIGHATLLSPLIILFGVQMIIGRDSLWLPRWICLRSVPVKFISFLKKKGLPFLKRVEERLGRGKKLVPQRTLHIPIGLVVVAMGLIMMIPIPFTNTIPALIVFILSLGLITNNDLLVLFSLIAGASLPIFFLIIITFII
ncbi:MAG: hypothetical protein DDT31_00557 [Syntrophomonadaceae bacterium]|nr:hypothetical protein [Bacillota bacterium]